MIIPDAKCVVNGGKVNEIANVLNTILNVVVSEEFDVVEYGNKPGRRWFFTGKLTGQKQDSASTGRDKLNTGSGAGSNNRDKLNTGVPSGGALKDNGGVNPPVRDNMPKFNGGGAMPKFDGGGVVGGGAMPKFNGGVVGGGAMPKYTGGAMVAGDAGQAARDFDDTMGSTPRIGGAMPKYPGDTTGGTGGGGFGGGTDAFGNELYADGTRVTPGGMPKYTGEGAPPLSGDSGRETRTLGDWVMGDASTNSGGATGGGETRPETGDARRRLPGDARRRLPGLSSNTSQQNARQAGESNADSLARQAAFSPDPSAFQALKRQIEQDMYWEKYKEAEEISRAAGVSFDSNKFNTQWGYQAQRRSVLVQREAEKMRDKYR